MKIQVTNPREVNKILANLEFIAIDFLESGGSKTDTAVIEHLGEYYFLEPFEYTATTHTENKSPEYWQGMQIAKRAKNPDLDADGYSPYAKDTQRHKDFVEGFNDFNNKVKN